MTQKIADLPPRKTLAGGFDAYCHVCWNPVYALWIDATDDPAGKCPMGHAKATDCPDAMGRAKFAGQMAKLCRPAGTCEGA